MIRVAALTSGKNVPSSRFRVRQHIEFLRNEGIDVREYVPAIDKYASPPNILEIGNPKYMRPVYAAWLGAKLLSRVPGVVGSWKSQLTWLEREIIPGRLTLEPILRRPYIFDLDDAIWLTKTSARTAVIKMVKNAEVVLAGNSYIADWVSSYAQDVKIVPTAIDTERFLPRNTMKENKRFVIGWTGTSGNYKYLYEIEKALQDFLNKYNAEILVIADKPPLFSRIKPEMVRYIQWSPAIEAEAVRQIDIGIMPLPFDEWSRGKCSFKMLQYMASGVPVVVSPVGMNAEILAMGNVGLPATTEADWFEALDYFYSNRELSNKWGAMGRMIVERNFSRRVVSGKIARIIKGLL